MTQKHNQQPRAKALENWPCGQCKCAIQTLCASSGQIRHECAHIHVNRFENKTCQNAGPAFCIHSKYPSNSRSICCFFLTFKNVKRFSTRSRSFANSLKTKFVTSPRCCFNDVTMIWYFSDAVKSKKINNNC